MSCDTLITKNFYLFNKILVSAISKAFPIPKNAHAPSLLVFCTSMIFNKNRGKDTILVMLDLSAAYDTVDQDILLTDLFALGIYGIVLEWFRTYL